MADRNTIVDRCDELCSSGRVDDALTLLSGAIASEPDKISYRLCRGRIYCDRLGETSKGVDDFEQALSLNPQSPVAHQYLCLCYLKEGKHDVALEHAEQAMDLNCDDEFSHYVLAKSRLAAERFHSAIKYFKSAIEIDSNRALFWEGLGTAYLESGAVDEAEQAYVQAIALEPTAILHIRLARVYLDAGNVSNAMKSLNRAERFKLTEAERLLVNGYAAIAKQSSLRGNGAED